MSKSDVINNILEFEQRNEYFNLYLYTIILLLNFFWGIFED